MKEKLISAPILIYPDFTKKFYLYTDISDSGLGAILSQKDNKERKWVVAYASILLKSAEKNYSDIEKEALAIVWTVRQFQHYLLESLFKIITNYNIF